MRAPILPYYGDQFLGIKPPAPYSLATSYIPTIGGASYRAPCMDVSDGSYYSHTSATALSRYNASNALVYTIGTTQIQIALASADNLLGLCYASNGTYYAVVFNSITKAAKLVTLSTSTNTLTGVGAGFTTTNAINGRPSEVTLWEQSDGNLRLRCTTSTTTGTVDVVISKAGAKISESIVSQAGRPITGYLMQYMQYETTDGTIQAGWSYYANDNMLIIVRNGKYCQIPMTIVKIPLSANSPILIRRYATWVNCCMYDATLHVGALGFTQSDFDRWLVDICNAMGL